MRRLNSKRWMALYTFLILSLSAVFFVIAFWLFFSIHRFEFFGNERISDKALAQWIQGEETLGENSLYVWAKFNLLKQDIHPGLDHMKVQLKSPATISVIAEEKRPAGYLINGETYVWVDRERTVLYTGEEYPEGLPCLEGVEVKKATLYETIVTEDEEKFKQMLAAAEGTQVRPERVVGSEENIYLMFGGICANLGSTGIDIKTDQLEPILAQLPEAVGTLHLELFQKSGDVIRFESGVLPEEITKNQLQNE